MKRLTGIILACVFLCACQQDSQETLPKGHVKASLAYLQHFGEPPVPQQGVAYARVGYLPLEDRSGQVRALPFYLFSDSLPLDRVLSQLFSADLALSKRSGLRKPSELGISLDKLDQVGDTLLVSLKIAAPVPAADKKAIARAITETAVQFDAVARVRVLFDGQSQATEPLEGYRSQKQLIAKVGPPELIDVFGSWEAGRKNPEEILVNFDRPVKVNSFRVSDQSGNQVSGEYFTSIFNMAVVLHPESPDRFQDGTKLKIEWDVTDHLDRRNSGVDDLELKRVNH